MQHPILPRLRRSMAISVVLGGALITSGVAGARSVHAGTSRASVPWASVGLGESLSPPKAIEFAPYVAQQEGFFAREHLHVKIISMPNGLETELGTVTQQIQIGLSSATDVIQSASVHAPIKAYWGSLGPLDTECIGGPGIHSVRDLIGKTVGTTGAGGFSYVTLQACLEAGHVRLNQVHVVSFASRSAFVPALVLGRIQAAVFHVDDGIAVMQQDPKLHVIAKEYQTVPNWWLQSMDARVEYARGHQSIMRRVITALILADRWMYSHKQAVVNIGVRVSGEDRYVVSRAYDFLARAHVWSLNSGFNKVAFRYTTRAMKKYGDITSVPTWNQVVDPVFANQVLKKIGVVNVNKYR